MKAGIIGGGIAGLSAAHYMKRFSLPLSQILLFESSNRFGGWLKSDRFIDNDLKSRNIMFEGGPRTIRIASGEVKELNTLQLVNELGLNDEIELISKEHPASQKRYLYVNGQIRLLKPTLLKMGFLSKPIFYYLIKEYMEKARSTDVKDESIYDFISRRTGGTEIADKILDPVIKGICGGNIKELSAQALLPGLFEAEIKYGGILKGMINKVGETSRNTSITKLASDNNYEDLIEIRKDYVGLSVWRFKNGIQTLSDSIVESLNKQNDVKLNLNESCLNIKHSDDKIILKTNRNEYEFDFIVSSVYSRDLAQMLPDEHEKLKNLLNKIESVDMIVVNLYFDRNITPVQGFGYLVPTIEKSPILGCIFDSVFDEMDNNYSLLTVMMGGALYKKYFNDNQDDDYILKLALDELKKQFKSKDDLKPKSYKVSILRKCIPQYKVGHQQLLNDIDDYLKQTKLDKKIYLIGNSYHGFSVNDVILNSRKLSQLYLKNNLL